MKKGRLAVCEPALFLALQACQVVQIVLVARPAGGALGLQQVLVMNQVTAQAFDLGVGRLREGLGKFQSLEPGDDVDGHRRMPKGEHVEGGVVQKISAVMSKVGIPKSWNARASRS